MATLTGTIPLSQIVTLNPTTLGVAGDVPFMNGLLITSNAATTAGATGPTTGQIKYYTSLADVTKDFPTTSPEAAMAATYFSSFEDAEQTPTTLLIYTNSCSLALMCPSS